MTFTQMSLHACFLISHSMADRGRFLDELHCHDGEADCSDVLYIFSVRPRISVSHEPVCSGLQHALHTKN